MLRLSIILLLLFCRRSYYLIVALTSEGHLNFEEDREGQTYGVRLDKNFLNGARHSVYYTRVNNSATLLVRHNKEISVDAQRRFLEIKNFFLIQSVNQKFIQKHFLALNLGSICNSFDYVWKKLLTMLSIDANFRDLCVNLLKYDFSFV